MPQGLAREREHPLEYRKQSLKGSIYKVYARRNNNKNRRNKMDWFKKHVDTVIILGAFATCMLWMNAQFNGIDSRFGQMEKDMAIIKTVLVMKNIMPSELAKAKE